MTAQTTPQLAQPLAVALPPTAGRTRNISDITAWLTDFAAGILTGSGERERMQRDAVIAFAIRVASAGLLYLTQVVLARWIGGHDYGIYVFVWTWVLVLGGLTNAGLNLAAIRLLPQYAESGSHDSMRGLLLGGRLFALGAGTCIALAGAGGLWIFGDVLASAYLLPAYLALVCVPLYALTDFQDGIGRGFGWMTSALLAPYILRPLCVLIAMLGANLMGLPMTATTAGCAAIIATWSAGLVQTLMVNARLREVVPTGPRTFDFKSWFAVSLPLVAMTGSELVLQNADVLVISRYLTPTDVGIYFAAAKTMALIMFVHYAVGSAVANRFAALHARGDTDSLHAFVRESINWTFWPSLAGAIAILALGKPLLWLFGPEFEAGYPVMFILVIGFLFRAAMGPAEFLLNMLGEQRRCAAVLAATAVLDIALNIILVPAYGLIGAATATATALVATATLNAMVARRRLGIDISIWNNLPLRRR